MPYQLFGRAFYRVPLFVQGLIVEDYRANRPIAEITKTYNVDHKTIYNILERQSASRDRSGKVTIAARTKMMARYYAGENVRLLAEEFGVGKSYFGMVAKRSGRPRQRKAKT